MREKELQRMGVFGAPKETLRSASTWQWQKIWNIKKVNLVSFYRVENITTELR